MHTWTLKTHHFSYGCNKIIYIYCFLFHPSVYCAKKKKPFNFCVEHKTSSCREELGLPGPINNNDITAELSVVLGVSTPEKELSFVKRCRVGSLNTLRQVLISAWVKYGVSSKNRSWGNTEPSSSSLLCPL